jgi:uncharacterized repeat protein (TIGR03803 family)
MAYLSSLLSLAAVFVIYQSSSAAPAIEPLVGFDIGGNPNITGTVRSPLYLHDDGYFYVSTLSGGAFNKGALLKMSKSGWLGSLSFSGAGLIHPGEGPVSPLVPSSDGWLWGTTAGGVVTSTYGTIYRTRPETGEFQTMYNFAGGTDGNAPYSGLVSDGAGNFWGVTRYTGNGTVSNGTIYRINERTGAFTRVYTFPGTSSSATNGRVPMAGLYHDGAGHLWGSTSLGGAQGYGTIFKYNIAAGTLTKVVDFSGNNALAGMIKGSDSLYTLVPDGNGFLWGMTSYTGYTSGNGTIFKVDMATNTATTVLEFSDAGATNKGKTPRGGLVNDGEGNLWGITETGGYLNRGTVFKISAASGVLTTVQQFGELAGANASVYSAWNGLSHDGEGNLWGVATTGGTATPWAVYKIRISDGSFTKVLEQAHGGVSYKGNTPLAGLTGSATSPWLWGTTSAGGTYNLGTLFRHNPTTGEHDTVVHFTGNTGAALGGKPSGKLFIDASGIVWGTTEIGGAFGTGTRNGTIFKYDPPSGVFTTVHSFNSGTKPKGALVGMSDGNIWGTTSSGTGTTVGTVFKISPGTNAVTTVYSFTSASNAPNGSEPVGNLVEDGSGFIWGVAQKGGGGSSTGVLFKIHMTSGAFTAVQVFPSASNMQSGDLVIDAAGSIYGSNSSRIFKYVPSTSTFQDIFINDLDYSRVTMGNLYKTSAGEIRFLGTEATRDLAVPHKDYLCPRAVVYQINTATNAFTRLRILEPGIVGTQTPADFPAVGGLYEHTDGHFYGVTQSSGTGPDLMPAGGGMIYRVSTGPVAMTQPYSSSNVTELFSKVSGTTVTLRGYANPNGNAITCQFEWGPTTKLGNVTNPIGTFGNEFTGNVCEAVLTGLSPNTTYFFRLRANSSGEAAYGPIRSLQTGAGISPAAPEISVESPIGRPLTDAMLPLNLGKHRVGTSHRQEVVARNLGQGVTGVSELTGLTATISGANAGDFVITTPFDRTTLSSATSMSTGLVLTFTPSGGGIRTAILTITSNDADEGTTVIPLTGEGLAQPEMQVISPASRVIGSDEDRYDFGRGGVNAPISQTFTIRNLGTAPLSNFNFTVGGIHAGEFVVTSPPASSIAPGKSSNFTVTFTPSVLGQRSATLRISSNVEDENPFLLQLGGSGYVGPEIQVLDDVVELTDNASTVAFGSIPAGGSSIRLLTIRNVGSVDLTGISLSLVGANMADFDFGNVASSVAPGQTSTFIVMFAPKSQGAKSATLRIVSNDIDESPFEILLSGTAAGTATSLSNFLENAGVPSHLRGANDDADFDGVANLIEYALDLNPNGTGGAFSGSIPSVTMTDTHLQLTYRRVRSDVTYQVEVSNDLSGGSWTTAGVNQGTPTGDGTITASIAIENGKAFLRLSVAHSN